MKRNALRTRTLYNTYTRLTINSILNPSRCNRIIYYIGNRSAMDQKIIHFLT